MSCMYEKSSKLFGCTLNSKNVIKWKKKLTNDWFNKCKNKTIMKDILIFD